MSKYHGVDPRVHPYPQGGDMDMVNEFLNRHIAGIMMMVLCIVHHFRRYH